MLLAGCVGSALEAVLPSLDKPSRRSKHRGRQVANTNEEAKEDDVDEADDEARRLVRPKPSSIGAHESSSQDAAVAANVSPDGTVLKPVALTSDGCPSSACFESLAEKAAKGLERGELFLESLPHYMRLRRSWERLNPWPPGIQGFRRHPTKQRQVGLELWWLIPSLRRPESTRHSAPVA